MSSLKNAVKGKAHKERHQPQNRSHLGLLEKKKDYKARARDFQNKRETLKSLRRKAVNRNPDEFYFHMVNSQTKEGTHFEKVKPEEFTDSQLKLMQTQDLNYINFRRIIEEKKIEKLQSQLHLLDTEGRPVNNHTIFVDSKHKAKNLDLAVHFGTHPALLGRTYNRPKLSTLKTTVLAADSEESMEFFTKERNKKYQELHKRIDRAKELTVLSQKMTIRKQLANKKDVVLKKIKDGTKDTAPVYLWMKERKK